MLLQEVKTFSRQEMAVHVASDIPEGWVVNLGVGMPTMVADYIGEDREVIFHSENGLLGMGAAPKKSEIDPWLINAGKQLVTLRPGGCYFHHADSFAMIRGGHIDLCVLGAFQVAANGDIANWARSTNDTAPAVGGAMDLAVGAKRVWVIMEHLTKSGESKIVEACTYPLTAISSVSRIYTDLATIDIIDGRLEVLDMAPGISFTDLQNLTEAKLYRVSDGKL